MARPIKNNCDYFPHDGGMRNHRKIKAIIQKFGIEGYAHWSIMLEILTTSTDFTITLSNDIEWELMASEFHLTSEKLKVFVDYVVTLSLLEKENNKYWSENLIDRFSTLLNKRIRAKKAFDEGKEIEKIIGKKIISTNGVNRATRLLVYENSNFKCTNCNETDTDILDVHHVIPKYKGGSDEPENLKLLCANCHRKHHSCLVSVTETKFNDLETSQSKVKESKVKESLNGFLENDLKNETEIHHEDMIVKQMLDVWMKHNPKYQFEEITDYPALLNLAYKIAKTKNWSKEDVIKTKLPECLLSWDKIAAFIKQHDFYKQLQIKVIEKNWSGLYQTMDAFKEGSKKIEAVDPTKLKLKFK